MPDATAVVTSNCGPKSPVYSDSLICQYASLLDCQAISDPAMSSSLFMTEKREKPATSMAASPEAFKVQALEPDKIHAFAVLNAVVWAVS